MEIRNRDGRARPRRYFDDHRVVSPVGHTIRVAWRVHSRPPPRRDDRIGVLVCGRDASHAAPVPFFHQEGSSHRDAVGGKKKFDILDFMQAAYNRAIVFLMGRKWIALGAGIAAFVAGVLLFTTVPQQFFPSAERNQFVIDVWMPPVTRLEQTDSVIQRIQTFLKKKTVVEHVATFAEQSFPRFYYNVSPQEPDTPYGQLIVITRSANETPALIETLRSELPELARKPW